MSRTPRIRRSLAILIVNLAVLPATAQTPRAVDDAALLHPRPEEWLVYGRDYAGTHYSPLSQIRVDNVQRLRFAWSWEIGTRQGRPEATPLVSNAVLYASGAWCVPRP